MDKKLIKIIYWPLIKKKKKKKKNNKQKKTLY